MGVYINMEMPESGTYEVSIDSANGKDKTVMSLFVRGEGGLICCGVYELVPVPPHGRLGDLDVLVEKAWDADTRCGYVQVVDVGDILDAPTIIEADKAVPIPPKSKEQQDLEDLVERLNREGIAP